MSQQLKTPAARLLDLLVGWANLVEEEEAQPGHPVDSRVSVDDICKLYQDAGSALANIAGEDTEAENAAVRQILEEQVMPLLLRR
jgi:hypothetical protein